MVTAFHCEPHTPAPYIRSFQPYLAELLGSNGYPGVRIETLEALPHRGRVGHPIIVCRASWGSHSCCFSLHFRQTSRTVQQELRALKHARARGVNAPRVVYADSSDANAFGAPFILREFVLGVPLADNPNVISEAPLLLAESLLKLHEPEAGRYGPPSRAPIEFHKQTFEDSLIADRLHDRVQLVRILDDLIGYYTAHANTLALNSRSLVHGELHPSRIIVTPDGSLWFVNWEFAKEGDYCYDLAYARLALFGPVATVEPVQFSALVKLYEDTFADHTVTERLRFYLAERCLSYISRLCGSAENETPVRLWFAILASALKVSLS